MMQVVYVSSPLHIHSSNGRGFPRRSTRDDRTLAEGHRLAEATADPARLRSLRVAISMQIDRRDAQNVAETCTLPHAYLWRDRAAAELSTRWAWDDRRSAGLSPPPSTSGSLAAKDNVCNQLQIADTRRRAMQASVVSVDGPIGQRVSLTASTRRRV